MSFRLGVSDPHNFYFLHSCFQEFSNNDDDDNDDDDDDNDDDDDDDDEAEEENIDDLHKSMTAAADNVFDFISDFC